MNYRSTSLLLFALVVNSCSPSPHQEPTSTTHFPGWQILSGTHFENWTGVDVSPDAPEATLQNSGEADFRYPDGPKGWIKHGFRLTNDGTADWHDCQGLKLEIHLADDRAAKVKVFIGTPNEQDEASMVSGAVTIRGAGWHTVTMPWSAFAFDHANTSFLQYVKEVRIAVTSPDGGTGGPTLMRNVRVVEGDPLALKCDVRGRSVLPGQSARYDVTVTNCTDVPQSVGLSFVRHGWESMAATVEPESLDLAPGEGKACVVQVAVPDHVAPGGHEEQVLQAIGNGTGDKAATLTLITAHALPHPYILHTPAAWQEIRDKVKHYPWAKAAQDDYVALAEKWEVPEVAKPPHNDPDDTMGPCIFPTGNEAGLMASGIFWQLTGEKKYAEKVAEFLRRWSDPRDGYPTTFRGCNQGFVQEGHFTQHIAMAYDMILDSGVLSPGDIEQINASLRLDMQTIDLGNQGGAINNWNLSELTGAFYGALVLQDLSAADRFFAGPTGIKNQLAKGAMDDGWWYECSVSYNTWCTSEFSQAALAYEPWGVNFKDMQVPASYFRDAALSSASGRAGLNGGNTTAGQNINEKERPFGMCKEIWGPNTKPYRQIRDMWNSLPPFLDYRGVMFGINDTTEKRPANQDGAFDLAYYLFRDPVYAGAAKKADKRSLLYGVPDLPEKTPDVSSLSAYADNAGVAMLRSQTPNRPQSDQIQAVLHYGTHGWAHGHFDRTDLLSLMRYGRSFYNPEMIWYSYEPFLYKFYVQTSVNHNMVVVDQKMQEPVESKRLLFYTGKAFQATAVETDAPWSNPPYGGMVYDYVPVKTFAEKCWREGRSVPIPDKVPTYGSLTDYTEPVLQRRLMIVTDDYVVLADYMKAKEKHTFDSLLQLTGFQGLEATGKTLARHDAQWNPDPVSSAQFVTDCDWYTAQAPARAHFSMFWKSDPQDPKKNIAPTLCSEDGTLNLDVLSLWPQAQQIMVGQAPQNEGNEKKLWYTVTGDGRILDQGQFGSWILGQANIDVPVQGLKQLDLETKVEGATKNTLFWGDARVVTTDGKEIPLSKLPVKFENVAQPPAPGKDYYGGPIKIVGNDYSEATPAEPQDAKAGGVAHVDLSAVQAVRFKATLGGAYPLGNASQLRKVYSIRSEGTEARFLTLIEPFDQKSVIKSAQALSADKFQVELTDGRIQELTINHLEGAGDDISISMNETKNGQPVRSENSASPQP
jgi:hypothetical protein